MTKATFVFLFGLRQRVLQGTSNNCEKGRERFIDEHMFARFPIDL